jgi:hypothetical protein
MQFSWALRVLVSQAARSPATRIPEDPHQKGGQHSPSGMFRSSSPLIALVGCMSLMSPTQLKTPTVRPVLPFIETQADCMTWQLHDMAGLQLTGPLLLLSVVFSLP